MVRCKFRVYEKIEKENYYCIDGCNKPTIVKLTPCSGFPFGQYTPNGNIEMFILNDEAEKQFIIGQEYYVDFTLSQKE